MIHELEYKMIYFMKRLFKSEMTVCVRLALCVVFLGGSVVRCHTHEHKKGPHDGHIFSHAHSLSQSPVNTYNLHGVYTDDHPQSHECCCNSSNPHPVGRDPKNTFTVNQTRSVVKLSAASASEIPSDFIANIIAQPPLSQDISNPTLSSLRTVVLLA